MVYLLNRTSTTTFSFPLLCLHTTKKVIFTNMGSYVVISTFTVGKTLYQHILVCC